MFGRVIIAAILGGVLAFAGGFVGHEVLQLGQRAIKKPASTEAVKQAVRTLFSEPGIYGVPYPDKPGMKMTEEELKAFVAEYRAGPVARVVVAPQSDDTTMYKMMAFEGATNFVCALIIAIVLAMTRPSVGFIGRWIIAILIGVFAWASISASNFIWYGYPLEYVRDELLCQALEWAAAGFIIAAIVRPREIVRY